MPLVNHPYGIAAAGEMNNLELELQAFLLNPKEGLGKAEHFWNVVSILWGPKSTKPFVRHPWAERMCAAACEYDYVGVSGCGSSGKTDFFAVWGIVNWLAAPKDTLVFCTSTSLKESGKRIWGSVKAYYTAAGLEGVGKLVESLHMIRTNDGSGVFNDKEGISCIAGEKKDEKDAIGKLIGAKNKRVFLIADELPELTESILTAAFSNLALNPSFQLVALGNFKSIFDAFGVFVRPKKGYGSITVEDKEWETEHGICLHLDGMRSPNLVDGKDKWPIYDSKNLAKHRSTYGPNSAEFWRMCRSFPSPEGNESVLYSDVDFMRGDAHAPAVWLDVPELCAAGDPAFTNEGDKFARVSGKFGKSSTGLPTLEITGYKYIYENVALTQKGEPRDLQTARQFGECATDEKCRAENVGVDCSGPGGLAFGSILSAVWSSRFLPVKFGEKPSQRLVSEDDTKTCDEAFHNRVTELWAIGKHFVRAGQIKGLPVEIAKELKARHYETIKGVQLKIKVESKRDMKARLGFSPDLADAFLILVELCRERFGFTPGAMNGLSEVPKGNDWIAQSNAAHEIYDPALAYSESPYHAQTA